MFLKIEKDGHMHSPFCPHGSSDSFEMYIEKALENNLKEITFTEHLPFPDSVVDPSHKNDSAMSILDIEAYMEEVKKYKEIYKDKLKINLGFEVDYIEGYESETRELLDKYGPNMEDSLIANHILNIDNELFMIDRNVEHFTNLLDKVGDIESVYKSYYSSVLKMVESDLGKYKPKRVAHINYIRTLAKLFPYDYMKEKDTIEKILKVMSQKGMELDYNVSGLLKPNCGEIYVPKDIVEMSKKYAIPLVFGSDSHMARYVGERIDITPPKHPTPFIFNNTSRQTEYFMEKLE